MAASHRPFHHDLFPAHIRYPVLVLTYVLIKPLLWLVERAGYAGRFWAAVGRKMKAKMLTGYDFGDYRPSRHDVVVCTFPKCGTNWTMQIAYQIAMRGKGEFRHIHDVVPWPDFARQDLVVPLLDDTARQAAPTGLRVIKTHLEWERIPYTPDARYICILRDPKDAFVSNYPFVRDVMFGPLMPAVPVWLRLFFSDAAPFSWSEHLHGYWKNRHLPNLSILTFDEMKQDMAAVVRRIAEFMQVELAQEEFAAVCEKSSFVYMKSIDDKFKPPALTPWSSPNRQMIRRGVSGGSAELLSPEQQDFIDTICRAELARIGSDFAYDAVWGNQTGEENTETSVQSVEQSSA